MPEDENETSRARAGSNLAAPKSSFSRAEPRPSGSEAAPRALGEAGTAGGSGVDGAEALRRGAKGELLHLALLFVTTRIALVVIGLVARAVTPGRPEHPRPLGLGTPFYSRFPFLDIWGQWDSSWYLSIASYGYRAEPLDGPYANYAFFPLYPLLSRAVGWVFGSAFFGGLVVSNVAFLVACVFLYRLVLLDHDAETARRSVKYLFLAPVAFLFSALMTESLYVALVVMCFYFARRRRWWVVAALGFLVALARVPGVLLVVPLAWVYLQQRGYSLRRVRFDVVAFAAFPLGLGCFMWFNRHLTGDAFAFVHIQKTAWAHRVENPVSALVRLISSRDVFERFAGWYTLAGLVLILVFVKKLGMAYGLFALSSLLLPLSSGGGPWGSMPRYLLVIFPLYIVAAQFTRQRPALDQALCIGLAMTQGFLMTFWVNNSNLVV